ncbi:sugar kinase, partial [mine drainage metagenome]
IQLGLDKGRMTLVGPARSQEILRALKPIAKSGGGSGANTAIGLSALGARSALIAKVADDRMGRLFRDNMKSRGVSFYPIIAINPADDPLHGLDTSWKTNTGTCIVLVSPDGERTMATNLGVASTLQPEEIDLEIMTTASVLYIEAYLWDLPSTRKAISDAMIAVRNRGGKGFLQPIGCLMRGTPPRRFSATCIQPRRFTIQQ